MKNVLVSLPNVVENNTTIVCANKRILFKMPLRLKIQVRKTVIGLILIYSQSNVILQVCEKHAVIQKSD